MKNALRALALAPMSGFRTSVVHVPEWENVSVKLREPSGKAWLEWRQIVNPEQDEGDESQPLSAAQVAHRNMQADVVLFIDVLLDDNDQPVNAFGSSAFIEVAALCSMDSGDLFDLVDEAVRESDAFHNVQDGVDTSLDGILQNALANNSTVEHQWQQYGEVRADVITIKTSIATVEGSLAELQDIVQAQYGELKAQVSQKLTAEVDDKGNGKASYTLNLGIKRNDVMYNTGFGMSIEPSGGTYKSTVVFAADQFGIYSGSDPGNYQAAFFVVNGQVFIRDALIQTASITSAKIAKAAIGSANIADYLQSDDYVAKSSGIRIGFRNGTIEINSTTPGQGGVIIDSTGIATFDENNIRRAKLGKIR